MTSNLPVAQADATLDLLGGQASLFDDPAKLLTWEEGVLRNVAANLGREGGSILAQLRRAAGLVAWAGWHRFDAKVYEEFLSGLAGQLGVEVRSLRRWRDAQVEKGTLAQPAIATTRKSEAKARSKPAGQDRYVTTLAPIPANSSEVEQELAPAPSDPPSGGARRTPVPPPVTEGPPPSPPAPPDPRTDPIRELVDDLQAVTTVNLRAYNGPWRVILETEVRRAAEALGIVRRQGTITLPAERSRNTVRTDKPQTTTLTGKGHALDCRCYGCVPPKAVAK